MLLGKHSALIIIAKKLIDGNTIIKQYKYTEENILN